MKVYLKKKQLIEIWILDEYQNANKPPTDLMPSSNHSRTPILYHRIILGIRIDITLCLRPIEMVFHNLQRIVKFRWFSYCALSLRLKSRRDLQPEFKSLIFSRNIACNFLNWWLKQLNDSVPRKKENKREFSKFVFSLFEILLSTS